MTRLLAFYMAECEKEEAQEKDVAFKDQMFITDPERYFKVFEQPQQPMLDFDYGEDFEIPQGEDDLKKIRRELYSEGLLSPEEIALIETERGE